MEYLTTEVLLGVSTVLAFVAAAWLVYWLGPATDELSGRIIADLTPQMQSLRMNTGMLHIYLRIWAVALVAAFVILGPFLNMYPLAIVAGYVLYVLPRLALDALIEQRRRLLRDQMVSACVGLSGAARAGMSLAQGLEVVAADTPEPLREELQRIVFEWRCGRPLTDSLADVRERLNLDGFTLFAHTISACLERGGPVNEALERISHSLRENQRFDRQLEAETASGRRVVWILACVPLGFLMLFGLADPTLIGVLFSTVLGQVVLVGVIGTVYVAVRWCLRILSLEF